MELDLTVRHGVTRQNLRVRADAGVGLRAVRNAVAAAGGLDPHTPAWVDGSPLGDTGPWSGCGLTNGSVVDTEPPAGDRDGPAGSLALHVTGGPHAGRVVPLDRGSLVIGRAADCDVVLDDPDTSRRHALVEVSSAAIAVRDLGSTNGVTVDGVAVDGRAATLSAGAVVRIGTSLLTLSGAPDPPATSRTGAGGERRVVRAPRRARGPAERMVELPCRPADQRPHPVQWVAALLPAVAGGGVAWLTGSPEFLLFALLSPVMVLATSLGDRVSWRRSRRRAAAAFRSGSAAATRQVARALDDEARERHLAAPGPVVVGLTAAGPSDRLWERARGDVDLLQVRVGHGQVPSATQVREGSTARPAGRLDDVPVCVDLADGPLGMAGPRRVVSGAGRWLVGQLAVACAPSDVEIALLMSPGLMDDWSWASWLPHVRCGASVDPASWARTIEDLRARVQLGRSANSAIRAWTGPHLVLVVAGAEAVTAPGLASLLRDAPAAGVTAVLLATEVSTLPATCATVARVVDDAGSRVRIEGLHRPAPVEAVLDLVEIGWAERTARDLSPLVDAGGADDGATSLPDVWPLGRLHGLDDEGAISMAWDASDGGARADVGVGGDGPAVIDLVADGPHLLVAGTTGAGKSEFLQALVVGLAARQPPTDLTVLMIDYKGGAAFGECARLPHAAGLVTDLDPYTTERALRSLRSELRRRERVMADAGVADLTALRRLPGSSAPPRLVIVVDEFASLTEELPEFVSGLVAVAQRGRSLGVHLVLATQRPGSAVSPEIRANVALRVALRVTDRTDSVDVIDAPDAAAISRAIPGRALVRSGSSLRPIQTAWPGAPSTPSGHAVHVELLDAWRRPTSLPQPGACGTDLSRLVALIGSAAARRGGAPAQAPWAAALPTVLTRGEMPVPNADTTVFVGRVDLPDEQRVDLFGLDLCRGETMLVVGSARSGRTTALASVAAGATARLGPDVLELYVVDPAGRLTAMTSTLPHCATAVDGHDPDLLLRLLDRLVETCDRRAARRTAATPGSALTPRMLLLIDGWDAVTSTLADVDALRALDSLHTLLRSGAAAGLTVVVTGDRSVLTPRFSGAFGQRLALRLVDRADYAALGITPRDVPQELPPGRAVRASDSALVQLAAPAPQQGADERAGATSTRSGPPSPDAVRLRPLPASVQRTALPNRPGRFVLGAAGDAAAPLHLDPFAGAGRMLVAGPPRSGRSTVLRLLRVQAAEAGVAVVVAAGPRSPLTTEALAHGHAVFGPRQPIGDDLPEPSVPTLVLVDDCEAWQDTTLGDRLVEWVRRDDLPVAIVVAGASDELITTYRGVGAEIRRAGCGVLLRPGPLDGELLGLRLPRRPSAGPPGRGVVVGDPCWGDAFATSAALPIQIALP